jgi:hypothetical protein
MILRLRAPFAPQCRGSNRASGARRLSRKATPNAAGVKLDDLGGALERIFPSDRHREALLAEARQQYRRIIGERWAIVEQSEGTMSLALMTG